MRPAGQPSTKVLRKQNGEVVQSIGFGVRETSFQTLFISCVTMDKLHNLSMPQFPSVK